MTGAIVGAEIRRPCDPTSVHEGSRRCFAAADEMAHILVVDDDESICDVIDLILTDEGYDVACARTGEQALHLLQERPPALILFDLAMPDQRGEEFINACRQVPNGAVPMIVVSGFPNVDQIAGQIGADGFVAKPFELTGLLDAVQAALMSHEVA